ncbi:MAG TPA: DUF5939 domain-containing protein [Polyangiaceae bacterium]|nr:DUF5939 domain-containing protein [Polyangiaceae bacterium]
MTDEPLTLESFLAEHPWPAAMLEEGKPIEYLWRFDLEASLEGMWTHVSNTSRFNRALGLSEMSFDERAGLMHGESSAGGLKHEWVEPPWDWVKGRVMVAQRRYTRGFSKIVRTIFVFQELGPKRVRLYMYFGWIPRNLVWGWLLRLGMVPFQWRVRGLLEELARHDGEADPAVLAQPVSPLPEPVHARIDAHRRDLLARGLSDEAIDNLVSLIQGGDEMDLERLQPRKLARDWQLSEREVLRACLHGTRVGLLAMSWDVICPHCRGVRAELKNLGEVPKAGACEACAIDFGTDAPEAIEITFHVHPSIRKISRLQFCAAQLAGKRHIEVQQVLAPGERRTVPTSLTSGRHRVRVRGQLDVGYLLLAPDHERQQCTWRASDAPEEHPLKPEPTLEIDNDTDREQIFIVEEVSWSDDALRPTHLFSFQEFRDLFSEQYIGADVQLSVGEQPSCSPTSSARPASTSIAAIPRPS